MNEPVPLYANKVGPFHNPRWGLALQIPVVTSGSWVLGRDRIRWIRGMCGLFLRDLVGKCSGGVCATSVNADRFPRSRRQNRAPVIGSEWNCNWFSNLIRTFSEGLICFLLGLYRYSAKLWILQLVCIENNFFELWICYC
jgi:hypothetical protein